MKAKSFARPVGAFILALVLAAMLFGCGPTKKNKSSIKTDSLAIHKIDSSAFHKIDSGLVKKTDVKEKTENKYIKETYVFDPAYVSSNYPLFQFAERDSAQPYGRLIYYSKETGTASTEKQSNTSDSSYHSGIDSLHLQSNDLVQVNKVVTEKITIRKAPMWWKIIIPLLIIGIVIGRFGPRLFHTVMGKFAVIALLLTLSGCSTTMEVSKLKAEVKRLQFQVDSLTLKDVPEWNTSY